MFSGVRRWSPVAGLLAPLVWTLAPCASVQAQEVTPFRLVNVEGYVQMRSQAETYTSSQPGAVASQMSQDSLLGEVFLMTHSYIYHPNFISLNVGGGPVFQRGKSETEMGTSRGAATLYNFSARANLFNQKPVHGAVFHEHLNPTVTIAPGQVMNQQTVRQGLDFAVQESASPVPVQVSYSRTRSEGRSPERVVDDRSEQLSVTATRSLGAMGITRLQVQRLQQESQSGTPNLPIQASSNQTQSINLDTTLHLGDERQYTFTNQISQNAQTYGMTSVSVPDRHDLRWMADLRARHSDQWSSYLLSNYSSNRQGDIGSTYQGLSGGATYWHDPQLSMFAELLAEHTSATQFRMDNRMFNTGIRYQRDVWGGQANLNYSVRYEDRSQTAQATTTRVYGEKLTLSGFSWYALTHLNIVAGSVVVSDSTRSQTFLAGRDYIIVVAGAETRIQRTASGNILEGQEVLVDYQYDIGGSYEFSQVTHTASLSYAPTRYTTFSLRFLKTTPELKSGTPAYVLNHVQSTVAGMRTDYPISALDNAMVGFNLEGEERRETLLSSRSYALDTYVQFDDPWGAGNVRLSARQNKVRYTGPTPDVDMKGWGASYWMRVWGMDLSSNLAWERDAGGPEIRTRLTATLKAQWRVRRFSLNLNLGAYRERSGLFLRNNKSMTLNLRRDL